MAMKKSMKKAMKPAMKSAMKKSAMKKSAMKKSAMKKSAMKKAAKKSMKKGGKRPLNLFFSSMLKAKAAGAASFTYNGKTYKKKAGKNGMVFYKKA